MDFHDPGIWFLIGLTSLWVLILSVGIIRQLFGRDE